MHYWIRETCEKLFEIKCTPAKLPNRNRIRDQYHIYCCPQLGLGRVALWKIPCMCLACKEQINLPWINKMEHEQQPQLQLAAAYKYTNILGESYV